MIYLKVILKSTWIHKTLLIKKTCRTQYETDNIFGERRLFLTKSLKNSVRFIIIINSKHAKRSGSSYSTENFMISR